MALREVTYYIATCDFPGCDAEAEYGDYTAMGDPVSAIEMAEEGDWHAGAKPKECYCPKHPVVWDCDIEEGRETAPAPPYILIEDRSGDATLVTAEGEDR